MARQFFVAGTDTGVGKTFASCAILEAANRSGLKTIGLKPLAAGGEVIDGSLRNEDALALQCAASVELSYDQINPVVLEAATSPHIAASLSGRQVSVSRLSGFCRGAVMHKHDLALVEGAGGWRVPVNPRETMADLARELSYPVVFVVGLRLGCINHALLSIEAIMRDGLKIAGWIANRMSPDPMEYEAEYYQTLKAGIHAPCLGLLPFSEDGDAQAVSAHLDLSTLSL